MRCTAAWASAREVPASDVRPGLWVRLVAPDGSSAPDRVADVTLASSMGLYNPYTLAGSIVVDGVQASCHSSWVLDGLFRALGIPLPAGYQAAFAPLRALYRLIGPARAEALQAVALPLLHGEAAGAGPALAAAAAAAAVALAAASAARRSVRG